MHYVPGEHDVIDEEFGKSYRERYGKVPRARAGTASTTTACILSVSSTSSNLKAGGLGNLGDEQLAWLENDSRPAASTPIVVFAHVPLWTVYPEWGWGTEDGARALGLSSASVR